MSYMRHTLLTALFVASLAGCGGSGGSPPSDPNIQVISNMPVAGVIDSADNTEQLFGFEAQSDGVYNVLLNWPNPLSDLDLLIIDDLSNSYLTLGDNSTVESVNVAMLTGDILAIAVSALGGTTGPQDFTIAATATTQPAHSPGLVESEPNNDVPTGNFIFGQVSGIVDVTVDPDDFFIYFAPEAAMYTVLLTWTGPQHDLDLFIGWDTGTDFSADIGTELESITDLPLNLGEQLRVRVNAFDTGGIPVSYKLTVTAQ